MTSTKQKLTDLANDGINRLDEDDADELLGVIEENTRLREIAIDNHDSYEAEKAKITNLREKNIRLQEIETVASQIMDAREGDADWYECPEVFDVLFDRLAAALAAEGDGEDGS